MCLHNAGQKSCDANKIDPSKYIYTTFTNCQTLACFFQYNQDVKHNIEYLIMSNIIPLVKTFFYQILFIYSLNSDNGCQKENNLSNNHSFLVNNFQGKYLYLLWK